jgi:tRNA(Ile)-lysidine synthase
MREVKTKIGLKKFSKLHTSIRRLVLRAMIARIKGDTRRITLQHIKELEDLILNRPADSLVDLPKGVFVVKKKNALQFYRR